jgi:glycosyltransferase involved in cell wall biosynthesis
MRLLLLTQVLDRGDAVLGFVHRWVAGLARGCERLRVIALEVGDTTDLPAHVDAREVGRSGRVVRWLRYQGYLREALGRDGFDTVLAHMVPRYTLLAAPQARATGARQYLWYTHGGVDERLRRAEREVRAIFTASPESLRLDTPKRVVTGHGIDLQHFDDHGERPEAPPRLLAVGRLTPAKDPLCLVAALERLRERGRSVHLDLVGGELAAGDLAYGREVRETIARAGLEEHVHLHGAVPYREVPALYRSSTLLVSASRTGSVDKVVLEAMACRRPVVTCNEAFPRLFADLDADAERLSFPPGDAEALAARVEFLLDRPEGERAALGGRLRALVERDHEVDALMARLCAHMEAGR